MNKLVNALDLGYVEISIKSVVSSSLPQWFDKAFFFIFSYSFLRKVYSFGNFVDQIHLRVLAGGILLRALVLEAAAEVPSTSELVDSIARESPED